jgi:hypothetical protein
VIEQGILDGCSRSHAGGCACTGSIRIEVFGPKSGMDRRCCNRTILWGHRIVLFMRSSERLNGTPGMVNIICSRVVTIIVGSARVRIVIKNQGRNGCSRATLRGYRTDLCMKPSGGSGKSSRMVPTFLTRVTTMSNQSGKRSSDRSSGQVW